MTQITYLLGAGASANALPIVSEMAGKIFKLAEDSDINIYNRAPLLEPELIKDLKWLADICNPAKNFSVDTYAKQLYLTQELVEYHKLKNILSFYFTLQQKISNPDVRYKNFWASILESAREFPNNIKIISWNYDFQLELSYMDFLKTESLKDAAQQLNISSLEIHRLYKNPKEFGIFKLNGSATFNNSDDLSSYSYVVDKFKTENIKDFYKELTNIYHKFYLKNNELKDNFKNHLSFAWEHDTNSSFYKQLKNAVSDTEILVVIGYSFPFFNRKIDKLILEDFMGNSLRKVYFQATDAENLKERFLSINNKIKDVELVLRKDLNQFTLPYEL